METADMLIVGAGISGLMAARRLQDAGISSLVLEKSRGVGGRMATRRFGAPCEGATFDHGAQFFTVRHEAFQHWVQRWENAGMVDVWSYGWGRDDGHPRYRCRQGMTAIAKWLAQGLDVRRQQSVQQVTQRGTKWQVTTTAGATYEAARLLLTAPVPQSLALLAAGGVSLAARDAAALALIDYDPCFALMLCLDRPAQVPPPGAVQILGEPVQWVADNQQKGVSKMPALTIHAGPQFTRDHFDDEPATVAQRLQAAAHPWLGTAQVVQWQLQRWRYSQPVQLHPDRCLLAAGLPPLAFAGDAFYEARVEGAALSGLAAARALGHLRG